MRSSSPVLSTKLTTSKNCWIKTTWIWKAIKLVGCKDCWYSCDLWNKNKKKKLILSFSPISILLKILVYTLNWCLNKHHIDFNAPERRHTVVAVSFCMLRSWLSDNVLIGEFTETYKAPWECVLQNTLVFCWNVKLRYLLLRDYVSTYSEEDSL